MTDFDLTELISAETILILIVVIFFVSSALLLRSYLKSVRTFLQTEFESLHEEIKFSMQPEFVQVSSDTESLIDFAIEVWRIKKRIEDSLGKLSEAQEKGLRSSLHKLEKYLSTHGVEVKDYTNQKFNEGLNLDILSIEKDTTLDEPVVKETVEPSVLCNGRVVKRAKIILLDNRA